MSQPVGSQDGLQVLWFGEVEVQKIAFIRPAEAVDRREIRSQFPGVLRVKMQAVIVVGTRYGVIHGGSINGDANRFRTSAQNVHIELPVVFADARRRYGYARLQLRQLQKAAAVERQVVNLLLGDAAVDGVPVVRELCCERLGRDHFVGLPELEMHLRRCD